MDTASVIVGGSCFFGRWLCRYLTKGKPLGSDLDKGAPAEVYTLGFRAAVEIGVDRLVRFIGSMSVGFAEPSDSDIQRWTAHAMRK